jgi:hypothetical protein
MWKKLTYTLKSPGGDKEVDIYSHFKGEEDAASDRGKYTLKEAEELLGVLHVDLFVPDQSKWEGSKGALTHQQVFEIASFISAHDLGGEEPF